MNGALLAHLFDGMHSDHGAKVWVGAGSRRATMTIGAVPTRIGRAARSTTPRRFVCLERKAPHGNHFFGPGGAAVQSQGRLPPLGSRSRHPRKTQERRVRGLERLRRAKFFGFSSQRLPRCALRVRLSGPDTETVAFNSFWQTQPPPLSSPLIAADTADVVESHE